MSGGTIKISAEKSNSLRVQTSAYGLCLPLIYGKQRVVANMFWYSDFNAIANTTTTKSGGFLGVGKTKTKNTTYTYQAALMLGLGEAINSVDTIWIDKDQVKAKQNGSTTVSALAQRGLELFTGQSNSTWGYLTTHHPDQALTYPKLAYICSGNYDLGDSATLANHGFEVTGQYSISTSVPDANPADVIYDYIKNVNYGAAPDLNLASLTQFRTYCAAANLLVSPAFNEQRAAYEVINELVESVNCAVMASSAGLKIIPYGDATITGNGQTYTPNLTPVYHLTDDDFMDREEPIRVKRSRDSDAYNHCQIEYVNRHNQYNTEIVEAKDQANIEMFGLRTEDPVKLNHFCEPVIARHAVQLRLQRKLHIRNIYEFELGWKYCLLEPMDIVTLTDLSLGLNQFPVRIKDIDEDEDGQLTITAEELVIGVGSAINYDMQSSNGYQGGNEAPGPVIAPIIFEPPLSLTNGSNEVWVAVAGGANWGGCQVWVSYDNQSFSISGSVYGAARYGELVDSISAADTALKVALNTNQQIYSSSAVAVESDVSLVLVGNEYLSYLNSTLIGQQSYELTELGRGRYNAAAAHTANARVVILDSAIFNAQVNKNLVGKTIYLKFTSFNTLERKHEDLADVPAYSYTLVGGSPSGPTSLSLISPFTGNSFAVQWSFVSGASGYVVQILSDGILRRESEVTSTSYSYDYQDAASDGGPWRAYTVRVASKSGAAVSAFAEINISNTVPNAITGITTSAERNESKNVLNQTVVVHSINVSWDASTAIDLKDYQVWISSTNGFDPATMQPAWTGTATSCSLGPLSANTTYYIRVAARDVWGTGTLNYSVQAAQVTEQ